MSLRTDKVPTGYFSFKSTGLLKEQKPENKSNSYLKTFLSVPGWLTVLKRASTAAIFSIAVYKSPSLTQLAYIEGEKYFNRAASPVREENKITSKQELGEELKTFLWGKKGLSQESVVQRDDNCQIIANLIASTFTKEGLKSLESLIEVTDYNLDKTGFYINFKVNINGKSIPVSYSDLINRIGRRDPLAPHAIAYAVEKELAENYLPNPSGYTALSTATFITNKNYSALALSDLSDNSLVDILKRAPNEIIIVGSKSSPPNRTIVYEHAYAVKNYKYENEQHSITLAAYDKEVTLTLDELRNNMLTITAPASTFNPFDSETLEIYLFSLIALMAFRKAINNFQGNKEAKESTK